MYENFLFFKSIGYFVNPTSPTNTEMNSGHFECLLLKIWTKFSLMRACLS